MIVYFHPRAPFAKAVPRSDTMFGALSWAILTLFGRSELETLLAAFDEAIAAGQPPPFVLSSLLPFVEDDQGRILLLPRPLADEPFAPLPADASAVERARARKALRKIRFVSAAAFDATTGVDAALLDRFLDPAGDLRHMDGALCTREEFERIAPLERFETRGEIPRNAIDRIAWSTTGEAGQLFFEPAVAARSVGAIRTGYYMAVRLGDGDRNHIREIVASAARFLGDKGLGGDTAVGRGHCDVEIGDAPALFHRTGRRVTTLSLLHPSLADRAHFARVVDSVVARVERRKGFLESSFIPGARVWKPTLFMLAEGATFPTDGDRTCYGALVADDVDRAGMDFRPRLNGLGYTIALR